MTLEGMKQPVADRLETVKRALRKWDPVGVIESLEEGLNDAEPRSRWIRISHSRDARGKDGVGGISTDGPLA